MLFRSFIQEIEKVRKNTKVIQGPYGMGLMIAFTVFDGLPDQTIRFVKALFDAGVIGFIAGRNPTRVRFLMPAGGVTFEDIENVALIIEKTLIKMKRKES